MSAPRHANPRTNSEPDRLVPVLERGRQHHRRDHREDRAGGEGVDRTEHVAGRVAEQHPTDHRRDRAGERDADPHAR